MKHIFQKTHNKIISIMVAFDAGGRAEIDGYTPGIAHMLEHMIFKGTKKRTFLDIPREIAFLGGDVNAFTSHEMVMYYINVPYENFEAGIEILSDIVLNSTLPEEEFVKEREVVLEEALSYKDQPTYPLHEAFDETFYTGRLKHPLIGTEEDIQSFTREELVDFYNRFYTTTAGILTISGDIDVEVMRELAVKYFGPETEFIRQTKLEEHTYAKADNVFIEAKTEMEQSHVWIAYPGLEYGHKDSTKLKILQEILGSGMDSRLFMTVREMNNLCYGIGMGNSPNLESASLVIYSSTRMQNIEKMLALIDDELEKLKTELVSDEELERAKNKSRADVYSLYDSGRDMAKRRLTEAFYNLPTVEELSGRIDKVTREDVMELANKLFNDENKITFILGNKESAEEEEECL